MARKYGKKNEVDLNPLSFNTCILGESGIGKTTLAKEVCEKLVGEDGYIHLDIGREDGADAIEGIVSEKIEDFSKLQEVIDDIIENKDTDYKDLKVIIWDTLDEMIPILEAKAIKDWNRGKSSDKKADTINGACGGFGKGQEKAAGYLLDIIWNLKKIGVSSIIIGHVRRTDIIDSITQETYSKLTADTAQKYFNWIKNKMHFVALGYIDRSIVKEKTNRKNVVTKEDITINKATSESRMISFRDDTYSVDSKSRFADIVDKIPFDTDEFIKAIQDAIIKEKTKNGKSLKEAEKEQEKRDKENEKKQKENLKELNKSKINVEKNEQLKSEIQSKVIAMTDEKDKDNFRKLMEENGIESFSDVSEIPTKVLEDILKNIA